MPDDGLSQIEPTSVDTVDVAERLANETLIVDLDGYEGPLDILLVMARTQKVDMRNISVLALAEQYMAFVDRLARVFEIAAALAR